MDKEEGKMNLKRKSEPMDMLFDCEDDEPIGTLLKLKGKRKSKKIKVVEDGDLNKVKGVETVAVEDDELGGMDDTLESFRKKLRGPKKDGGSAVVKGEDLSSYVVEPSRESLTESAKDGELDPNLMPGVQKDGLGSIEGGSPGYATIEGLHLKAKMKNKRSKSSLDASISGRKSEFDGGLGHHESENYQLQHEKEIASELREETFEDSLSSFLQKVQSGLIQKSHSSSKLKQGKETQVSEQGSIPDSAVSSEAPAVKPCSVSKLVSKSMVLDDSVHTDPGQPSISTLICQKIDDRSVCTDSEQGFNSTSLRTNKIRGSNDSMDDSSSKEISGNLVSESLVRKSPSSLRACSNKIDGVQDEEIYSGDPGDQQGFTNVDPGYSNILDRSYGVSRCMGTKESRPLPSKEPTKCAIENIGNHLEPHVNFTKQEYDSEKIVDDSAHVKEPSPVSKEGACSPNYDHPSGREEANEISHSSIMLDQGSFLGDRRSQDDPETKETSISVVQRAARNAKRCRHGDMAYEGDADWEVLMQGQEFFVSHLVVDKSRERVKFSSMAVDAESGKAAAVSAGLRARAVGPLEKIKFKEVLKRKGGLQEYLECRNYILSVWNKDVSRILPLSDFGVSDACLVGESSRASLIRDIYIFLDQCGYINFGVPTEKDKSGNYIKRDLKLLTEKFGENSALPIVDSEDGVSFILEKEKSSETCIREENVDALVDGKQAGKCKTEDGVVDLQVLESSTPTVPEGCPHDDRQEINSLDPLPLKDMADLENLDPFPSYKDELGKMLTVVPPNISPPGEAVSAVPSKVPEGSTAVLSASINYESTQTHCHSEPSKHIIVVGAGPAGLTAARHLQRQGFSVIVLEARSRTGGRVFTDRSSLSVPVDLGASIITGVEADVATERRPDPSSLICSQLGLELTVLNSDCPLYDTVTGHKVPADLDQALEAEYNSLLDDMELLVAEKGERAMKMSLEEGLEYALKRRRSGLDDMGTELVKSPDTSVTGERFALDSNTQDFKTEGLSPLERRVIDWHFAHLEYGCAALLKEVSLPNWNQDDIYGGFGGAHCMIKGGYSAVVESLGEGICVHLDHVVTDITYFPKDCGTINGLHNKVKVSTSNGKEFSGDAVLVTVPLGCLKAETIKFSPSLPQWKYLSIKRLGFGILNKVVLEFSEVFWDDTVDYFGATADDADQRGWCFMFWNVRKTVGAPVLIALVVGKAAVDGQDISSSVHVSHALVVLRKLFGEDRVSDPVASVVTDWGRDPYSYGAYSYVAVGSSGEDYDLLGRPVDNCVFFAGEATCKEHPDTVGGAMMSGLREAVRISDIFNRGTDYTAEVEAMEAAKRHSNIEKSEVKDIIQRLDAVEFSGLVYRNSLDRSQISTWGSILKEMFFTAKTTAGRLHLAKKLLDLPVGFLKSFASTREGLSMLNTWILVTILFNVLFGPISRSGSGFCWI
ncbi:hypothetical protein RD792_012334 [Penstemon davidsonii]|uniref:SWIRM domain-containing protein n=1 Tax=Penstemon davidsonii TaxID=160366 RepID=A0ABR0CWZ6_9LAMI|nr:hypothetical protein RD792_012334 [Penstemon davidsonii]